MNRCIGTLTVVLLASAVLTTPAWAQPRRGFAGAPGSPGAGLEGERLERVIDALELTEEQREQVKPILAEHRQAVEQWREQSAGKMRELMEEMRQARQDGDAEKVESVRQQMQQLGESRRELHTGLMSKLDPVLTDEQMAKLRELGQERRERRAIAGWGRLDLTPEQREKIEKILDEADAKIMEILTPEQREQLQERRDRRRDRFGEWREQRQERRQQRDGQDAPQDAQ